MVGNGETIQCSGSCLDVPLFLSDQLVNVLFFVLQIHGADLVLGVQWLQSIGPFFSDYTNPSIHFSYNRKPITLTVFTPTPSRASFSQFCRFVFTDSISSLHTMTLTHKETQPAPNPETLS